MSAKLKVILGLILVTSGLALAKPVAVVTDLQGKASLRDGTPLGLLSYLEAGATVKVESDGRLKLSFVNGSSEALVTGPAEVQVGADSVKAVSGSEVVNKTAPKRVGLALPQHLNLDRPAGVRRDQDLGLILGGRALAGKRTLRWRATSKFKEFQILVENASSLKLVYEGVSAADQRQVSLPADALQPGQSYDVTLTGYTADGRPSEVRGRVLLLDESISARVKEAQSKAGGEGFSGRVSLLAAMLELGLDEEALALTETLLEERADDPNLQRLRVGLRRTLQIDS